MPLKEPLGMALAQVKSGHPAEAASTLFDAILHTGIHGAGRFKGAAEVADECLKHAEMDVEEAIKRVTRTHRRIVSLAAFGSGFGGLPLMGVTVPADVTVFYVQATRMTAAIAHLRGHDVNSEEVKSLIGITLLGSAGTELVSKLGVEIAGKMGVAALRKLPGRILIKINQAVGFRLLTKFGVKGAINLVKAVPVASAGVGASINAASISGIAKYAQSHFPPVHFERRTVDAH